MALPSFDLGRTAPSCLPAHSSSSLMTGFDFSCRTLRRSSRIRCFSSSVASGPARGTSRSISKSVLMSPTACSLRSRIEVRSLEKLPSDMRPAVGELEIRRAPRERLVGRVAVGHRDAFES